MVWAINTGRSVNSVSMAMLRDMFWISVIMNFHLVSEHVPGDENIWPDYLSRLSDSCSSSLTNDSATNQDA